MRWWACDNGHTVEITTHLAVFRACCPECIDGVYYRIETTVPEDDPARLVDAPA